MLSKSDSYSICNFIPIQASDLQILVSSASMENLDKMFNTGLFINDLSMHDCSRDLVLAGTQQQAELQMAMTTEKIKSAKLEQVSKDMDTMDTKVNSLLCNYVPRAISGTIIKGEPISNFCAVSQWFIGFNNDGGVFHITALCGEN